MSMVGWTQPHFIAHLSAAFRSGRGERLSLFGPLRMGLHSVRKPSK